MKRKILIFFIIGKRIRENILFFNEDIRLLNYYDYN